MIYFLFSFKISSELVCEKSVIFRKIYFYLFTIQKTSIVCNMSQEISTLWTSEFSIYLIFNLLGPVAHFRGGLSQFFSIHYLEGQICSEYARRNLNLVDADFYFPYWVEWHLRQGRSRPEPRGQALLFSTLTPRAGCLHKIHIRPSVSPPLYLATATN